MGILAQTGVFETTIKAYGKITISYKLPSAIEADKLFTDAGGKWDKETVFRACVTKIECPETPELEDVDSFLSANTVKAFWGCFNAIITGMWADVDSKN